MRSKIAIATLFAAFLLGGCAGTTSLRTTNSPIGLKIVKKNRGAFHDHTSEEIDSRIAYRNCLSDMNRRQMGPEAVKYCMCKTTPKEDQGPECQALLFGTPMSMSFGQSTMMPPAIFGPGMVGPMFYAPLGPMDYEGSIADSRTSSQAVSADEAKRQSGSSGSSADDKTMLDQIARNAEEARKAQERLDRLEAERSQNE